MRRALLALALIPPSVAIAAPQPAQQGAEHLLSSRLLRRSDARQSFSFRYPCLQAPAALMGERAALRDVNRHLESVATRALASFEADVRSLGNPPAAWSGAKHTLDATYTVVGQPAQEVVGLARTRHGCLPVTGWRGILAVRWDVYRSVAGAAHPTTEVITLNVREDGRVLRIQDLFVEGRGGLDSLALLATQRLESLGRKRGFTLSSPGGVPPVAASFAAFACTPRALHLYFQRGQVAAGVVGNLEVSLPWAELRALSPEVSQLLGPSRGR